MPRVYIGIGSNLGRRAEQIKRSLRLLGEGGFRIVRCSEVYETKPVDMTSGRDFLNLVVAADTHLSPLVAVAALRSIERALGRPNKHPRNLPRTLDLDLLLYGNQVIRTQGLMVPHPRMHKRWFVLKPLASIAPGRVHPVLHQRVTTLLRKLEREEGVKEWKSGARTVMATSST